MHTHPRAHRIPRLFTASLLALTLAGCAANNPDNLRKTLNEHPDIVLQALMANPALTVQTFEKLSVEARKLKAEQDRKEDAARMEQLAKDPNVGKIPAHRLARGERNAPIQVIVFSDFQCPYCAQGNSVLEEFRKKHGKKVVVLLRHIPLSFHPLALPAAQRFEALGLQSPEAAFKFHDEVFKNQKKLGQGGEKFLDEAAKRAGGNVAAMKAAMNSKRVMANLEEDKVEASKYGINGTPAFLVAGVLLRGAVPLSEFDAALEKPTPPPTSK